ncbi:MAG TPA: hypothetical protein PK156_42395 [Polyangium sp.]|nr:hypothetical protein [Polyangium sp.]
MDADPIVEEVRAARDEFAKLHNYDIDAMIRALQEESAKHGHLLVTLPPRLVADEQVCDAS